MEAMIVVFKTIRISWASGADANDFATSTRSLFGTPAAFSPSSAAYVAMTQLPHFVGNVPLEPVFWFIFWELTWRVWMLHHVLSLCFSAYALQSSTRSPRLHIQMLSRNKGILWYLIETNSVSKIIYKVCIVSIWPFVCIQIHYGRNFSNEVYTDIYTAGIIYL